ncbi:MAG: tRNA pseudouridine(55) synthase TruB [Candidatus Syntrophonatronum acetioxidans]|uniref:tRNA pseudouridine synthase B n=1 Tax=Candidatus Syntrophonatronum acetioxidans TaxID=1795816 RepID=A0A424YDY5_9FIRM|nr:MAG: tRNA pseudouridine(55) synthase TruB [Candidatus Syntrophonatronum acetioxidans]
MNTSQKPVIKMNGFINFLKPPGISSHQGIIFFRKLLKVKKVGHAGTLDPGAAGVLPVCLGKGTKASSYLMDTRKKYRAEIYLGVTTDTLDSWGKIVKELPLDGIYSRDIINVVENFKGKITQVPPMYSAIKKKGKPLYQVARRGDTVEREPREVFIYSLNIIYIDLPRVLLEVECSKGTYIRTLAADIGESLGVGASLSFLLRTKSGPFEINEGFTREEIEECYQAGRIQNLILPVDIAFLHLSQAVIKEEARKALMNGVSLDTASLQKYEISDKIVRIYSPAREFLALGRWQGHPPHLKLRPVKLFV